jgi:diguanylate cyclase (GGDEF)-like protein
MTNNRMNIGIFTCHIDNNYTREVCKGAEYAAKELDCNLIVFPGMFLNASFYDPTNQLYDYQYSSIYYYAHPESLDALIVCVGSIASYLSEKDIQEFLSRFDGIPILTLETEIPGYPCLTSDNASGMKKTMQHLINVHNRKHICFVAGKEDNEDSNQRLGIYKEFLEKNGLEFSDTMVARGDFSEYCREEVAELISNNPDMDAIVFANDQMALGGYAELKSHGIRIGEDVSVVGFDNSPSSVNMDPPLTTVDINSRELGYRAIHSAFKLSMGESSPVSSLESHFIERLSCGCKLCKETDIVPSSGDLLDKSLEETIALLDDVLFGEISSAFYAPRVYECFNQILRDIVTVVKSPNLDRFPVKSITDKLKSVLNSDLTEFYSAAEIAYVFRELASIISSCPLPPDKQQAFNTMYTTVSSTIALFMSNELYKQMQDNMVSGWSSIYITRDTLTYGNDLDRTYSSILDKLKGMEYEGAYIYTYDDPIKLNSDGSWQVPKSIFLQAFYNQNNCQVLFGESRRTQSNEIFDNEYTYYDKRFTSVIVPIFTNEDHHGVFVCNTDFEHFNSIYSTSLQLGASLKYMALLKEQNIIQEQLKLSLNEIHEKNELLNQLSTLDELTGIYNRRGFMEKVEYYINIPSNIGKKAILLFADMDSLKVVNDKFGHKDGDFALRNIANILTMSFGPHDVIGRIGGDEFVCFAFIEDSSFVNEVQDRIKDYSAQLNATCGKPYFIEMSVGVSEFVCNGEQKIEDLLSQADNALYSNKRYKRMSILK